MTVSTLVDDPEARLDYLIEHGVLVEESDGAIFASDSFQSTLEVYEDTYLDESDETFVGTVASVFDLERERAEERIEETGLTREELATFLALRSHLDDPERTRDEVALMAAMVVGVEPASPVPSALTELDDEGYETYVDDHGDVVVFVFQRNCPPCEALKEDLPEMLDAAPDVVSFAGVDGDEAPAFRRAFEVSVAPTTLVFTDAELAVSLEGRKSAETLIEAFDAAYGTAEAE